MPSLAISKFTVLLEPLWVSAEFLLLSTGPLLYIILSSMDAVAEMQRTNIAAHALRLYWWKSRKCRCRKALRRFALPCSGYRHGTPKPGAIPTSLYPDIQFPPLYHGEGENQSFFCLWSFMWSKPLLCRFRQSG